ncbi:helix-hairpin-helix domain-containing protein [Cryobacterium sp. 1639]|uniref:ComEA family DNA-binding protein n=1 Tax=Cryobacterium inferilacus TaxID=2866629 RepID=UPI001C72A010|nr:helix-hairpin-helix domain-containing protein [Cryobacterium sp. 1639]MBX0298871.1 helix-hairpin-helix domain-containing protein [Cryobacterium sp. 1639]
MVFDPYSSLAPSSRTTSSGSQPGPAGTVRTRLRLGVGAAVVLLLTALGVAVAVTAIAQVGHSVEVPATPGADDVGGSGEAGGSGATEPDPDPVAGNESALFSEAGDAAPGGTTGAEDSAVFVHVLGAVAHPGLFEVSAGARVVDVVAAAGGLLPTADQAGVNLARPVTDGEQLYVPAQGEVAPGAPAGAAGAATGSPGAAGTPQGAGAGTTVNLNTATVADLDTLPRIGPVMAQRILDYRAAEGRFDSIEDLRNVTGIGDKTFAALQDLISV